MTPNGQEGRASLLTKLLVGVYLGSIALFILAVMVIILIPVAYLLGIRSSPPSPGSDGIFPLLPFLALAIVLSNFALWFSSKRDRHD